MSDDDLDKNAVAEFFMLVAGVSTIVFGLSTDLPFLVAPSVLYAARETGYVLQYAVKKTIPKLVQKNARLLSVGCSVMRAVTKCSGPLSKLPRYPNAPVP